MDTNRYDNRFERVVLQVADVNRICGEIQLPISYVTQGLNLKLFDDDGKNCFLDSISITKYKYLRKFLCQNLK